MKRFIIVSVIFLFAFSAGAQGFKQSVGIRASWISPGFDYHLYLSESNSLRTLLTIRDRGIQLHAFSKYYQYDLFPFSYQLIFYYGAGIHAGYETWDNIVIQNDQRRAVTHSSFLAGFDGLIGLEYLFYEAPVKVGLEAKPYFDVFGRNNFSVYLPDFAFTVSYLF